MGGLDSGLAPERGNLDDLAEKARNGTLKPDDPIFNEDPRGKRNDEQN